MTLLHAPLGAIAIMRRPLRPGHVLVTLEDQIIVTWRVVDEATLTDRPILDLGAPEWALYVRSVDCEIYLPARVVSCS